MFKGDMIVNEILDFAFSTPLDFPNNFMYKRLTDPILAPYHEPSLTVDKLKNILELNDPTNEDELLKTVQGKCFYLYEFLDREKKETKDIFKFVSNFSPSDPIFSSEAVINILEYKWTSYARKIYFTEALYFFIFLCFYVLNVDYFFVSRIRSIGINEEKQMAFTVFSIFLDLIIFVFIFRLLFHEAKQLYYFGFKDYFYSFWNFNDVCYITFTLVATTFDLLLCFDLFTYIDIVKCCQSLAIFFAFFRLLSYARGVEQTSFMIKLILEVIYDIRYFLFIMILFIFSLSFSSNI